MVNHFPKVIAVVGGKHSGKTTVIEHLILGLKIRGHRVGTIKEMVRIPTLDTPQKETDRYTKAGSEINVAIPRNETVIFIKKRLVLEQILPYLHDLDFVLLEGFESENIPKIIAAKTAQEAERYLDELTIAVAGIITRNEYEKTKIGKKIAVVDTGTNMEELINLIQKALT